MAVGTYTLPICDRCKRPWLPNKWKQDSNPRGPEGSGLRCGKCKSLGWDRKHEEQVKRDTNVQLRTGNTTEAAELPEMPCSGDEGLSEAADVDTKSAQEDELPQLRECLPETWETKTQAMRKVRERQKPDASSGLQQTPGGGLDVPSMSSPAASGRRCKHRMTNCPLCTKEAA
jgi:hypothetical protein